MTPDAILWPALALVAVTLAVWLRMYRTRIAAMREHKIHPQAVATRAAVHDKMAVSPIATQAANNFENLFELPVLFYVLVVLLHQRPAVATGFVAGAWLYVALRATHSFIQCSYNKVMHRFMVYFASSWVLWALWGAFAVSLVR